MNENNIDLIQTALDTTIQKGAFENIRAAAMVYSAFEAIKERLRENNGYIKELQERIKTYEERLVKLPQQKQV